MQNVSKFVLQSPNHVKDEAKSDIASLSAWIFAYWTIAPLEVCLAVAIPSKDEEEPRHRISPCMDFGYWTIASLLTFLSPTTPILPNTNHATRFLEKGEGCSAEGLEVCLAVAKPCQRRNKIRHRISPCTDQTSPKPCQRRGKILHRISPYMDQTCTPIPVAPSSENDVLSLPANR